MALAAVCSELLVLLLLLFVVAFIVCGVSDRYLMFLQCLVLSSFAIISLVFCCVLNVMSLLLSFDSYLVSWVGL